ncbi:MAG: Nif3-like dinuclear metal center hexameric protein [Bacteroidota bacterium]
MRVKDIIVFFEKIAPVSLKESYDNVGLLVGSNEKEISKALICIDVTQAILDEAVSKGCDLIISHHPLIFSPIKNVTGQTPTGQIIISAIKNDIAVYAIHTNIDNSILGFNSLAAEKMGLTDVTILSPKTGLLRKLVTFCPDEHAPAVRDALFAAGCGHIGNYDSCSYNLNGQGSFRGLENAHPFVGTPGIIHFENEVRIETIFPSSMQSSVLKALFAAHPYEEVAYDIYPLDNDYKGAGSGVIGTLKPGVAASDLMVMLKDIFKIPCIRHSDPIEKEIRKVAFCGGAGSFLAREAKAKGADILITGDLKYHDFANADSEFMLADIGHFESEFCFREHIQSLMNKKFATFAVLLSEAEENPINYL